jgi:hypothetical protein
VKIPEKPGKTNDDVRLANINANKVELKWTTGENLALTVPHKCWFGIQDQRIWGKKTIGICLTPPLKRNVEGGEKSTFMLAFATDGP